MKITLTKKDAQLLVPEIYDVVDRLPNKLFGYSNKKVKRFLKKLTTEEVVETAKLGKHISLQSDAKKVAICIPEEVLDTYRFFPQSPFHTVLYDIVDEKLPGKHRGLILTVLSLLASDMVGDPSSRRYQKQVSAIEAWRNSPDVYMELAQRMFTDFQKETNVHEEPTPERSVSNMWHKTESNFGDVPMDLELTLHDNEDEVELLIQATFLCEEDAEFDLALDRSGFGEICSEVVDAANTQFDCCRFWNGFDSDSVVRVKNVLTAKFAGYAAPQGDDPWADYTSVKWGEMIEFIAEHIISKIEDAEAMYTPSEMILLHKEGREFIGRRDDDRIRITTSLSKRMEDLTTKGEEIYRLRLNALVMLEDDFWNDRMIRENIKTFLDHHKEFLIKMVSCDYDNDAITPYNSIMYGLDRKQFSWDLYFGIPYGVPAECCDDICRTVATYGLDELIELLNPCLEDEEVVRTSITGLRKPIIVTKEEEDKTPVEEDSSEHGPENDIDVRIVEQKDGKGKDALHFDCSIRLFYPKNHRGPKSDTETAIKNYYLKKMTKIKTRFMEEILNPIGEEQDAAIVIGRTKMSGDGESFYSFDFSINVGSLKAKMKADDRNALIRKIYETRNGLTQIVSELYK